MSRRESPESAPLPVTEAEVKRIRERLAPAATVARSTETLLSELPAPTSVEVARVQARIASSRRAPRRTWQPARGFAVAIPALAVAILAWVQTRPVPQPERTVGSSILEGEQLIEPMAEVALEYQGNGNAEWQGKDIRVDWERGTLTGDVEHGQGIRMSVHTREGVVKVVGTRFTVRRDAQGSLISVDHGVVEVTCDGGTDATVTDGESHRCPPVSPGQWTANVDRLLRRGASAEAVERTIARGLQYAEASTPVRGELLARQVQLDLREERFEAAASVARQYLDEGFTTRAAQLRPVAELVSSPASQTDSPPRPPPGVNP